MRLVTEQGYIDGVAMLFEVNDEQLEKIHSNPNYYFDQAFIDELKESKGDNAYVFTLCNNGNSDWIYKQLKAVVKEDYKTVSWWEKDLKEFKIIRR